MNDNDLVFEIIRITEFSFRVNELLFELDRPVRIQFQHFTAYDSVNDYVDLTLRVYYTYDTTNIPPDSVLVDFEVSNIFRVHNVTQYLIDDADYVLPQSLITQMVSIAISHTRALMSRNIAGTRYQSNLIPLINPIEVTKAFYPHMFKEEVSVSPSIKAVDGRKASKSQKIKH